MFNWIIDVEGITKKFQNEPVLKDVSLKVPSGQVVGISGHNGSGKSVLLRIICGFMRPDQGQVTIRQQVVGQQIEFPDRTGILIDGVGFINHLSGFCNLKLLAMIRNRISDEQIRDSMKIVGLDPDNKVSVAKYSTGMRQRLGLAQAIMEAPDLLILDEPTSNIDREGTTEIQALLRQLATTGNTILLTSHSAQELNDICHQVYELERGKLRRV